MRIARVVCLVSGAFVFMGCPAKDESSGTGLADVTVTATSMSGAPLAGQTILVHDAQGLFLNFDTTNVDGTVTLSVPEGSTISVLSESSVEMGVDATFTQSTLRTFMNVADGDSLRAAFLVVDEVPVPPAVLGTANVAFPGTFAGATYYTGGFVGSCASTGTPDPTGVFAFPINADCLPSASTITPLAFARNASTVPIAFSLGAPVAPSTVYSTTTTFPSWRTDWDTLDVDVTGLPPGTFDVSGGVYQLDAAGRYIYADSFFSTATGGAVGATLNLLPLSYAYAEAQFSVGDANAQSFLRTRSPGDLASLPIDASVLLGPILSSTIAVSGSSASYSWSASDVDQADELWSWTYWYDGGVAPPDLHFVNWSVSAPPDTPSPFRLPELPEEYATWRPSRVQTGFNLFLEYRERADLDGWDGARNADPLQMPETFVERKSTRRFDAL